MAASARDVLLASECITVWTTECEARIPMATRHEGKINRHAPAQNEQSATRCAAEKKPEEARRSPRETATEVEDPEERNIIIAFLSY